MKNKFTLLLVLASIIGNAQKVISFESEEGFKLGNLNTQENWEVSESSDGKILENQIITDEFASDGKFSFKNGYEKDYGFQWLPIMGASKKFETPLDYKNFTISFDTYVIERGGSDFEFTLYTISNDDFYPVAGLGLENRGYLYITKDINYGFDYADDGKDWEINKWNNFKIEVKEDSIKYYLNSKLIYTGDNFTKKSIYGLTMLHNNYGGNSFYDNFKIITNDDQLTTTDIKLDQIKLYPNPTKDILYIDSNNFINEISSIEITNTVGQIVFQSQKTLDKVNIDKLINGIYYVKIRLKDGQNITRKIIKK